MNTYLLSTKILCFFFPFFICWAVWKCSCHDTSLNAWAWLSWEQRAALRSSARASPPRRWTVMPCGRSVPILCLVSSLVPEMSHSSFYFFIVHSWLCFCFFDLCNLIYLTLFWALLCFLEQYLPNFSVSWITWDVLLNANSVFIGLGWGILAF